MISGADKSKYKASYDKLNDDKDEEEEKTHPLDVDQEQDQDLEINLNYGETKYQLESQNQPSQLQVESQPKPKLEPLKARCRRLFEGTSQIWQIDMNSVYEKRAFFMSPCPPGFKMQCIFKIFQGCCFQRYECYLVKFDFIV